MATWHLQQDSQYFVLPDPLLEFCSIPAFQRQLPLNFGSGSLSLDCLSHPSHNYNDIPFRLLRQPVVSWLNS